MSLDPHAPEAMQGFTDRTIAGGEHFRDAALQLAAAMGGMRGVIAEQQLSPTEEAMDVDVHAKHLTVSMLTPEAKEHVPAAVYVVNAICRGIQAQMGRSE